MSDAEVVPIPPDEDRGPHFLALLWVLVSLATVTVACRAYVRWRDPFLEDWLMLVAWLLLIANGVVNIFNITLGGLRHVYYVEDQVPSILKFGSASIVTNILCLTACKASIAFLLVHIFGPTARLRKAFLYSILVVLVVLGLANIIFIFIACIPTEASWQPKEQAAGRADCSLRDAYLQITLATQGKFHMTDEISLLCYILTYAVAAIAFQAFADFAMALLPISFLIHLQRPRSERFVIGILLGLGIVAGICGCFKTYLTKSNLNSSDPTWDIYHVKIWTATEVPLIVIAGCIPTLKPLWNAMKETYFNLWRSPNSPETVMHRENKYAFANSVLYHRSSSNSA